MKMEIDVAEFAAQLKVGKGIGGKDGALILKDDILETLLYILHIR